MRNKRKPMTCGRLLAAVAVILATLAALPAPASAEAACDGESSAVLAGFLGDAARTAKALGPARKGVEMRDRLRHRVVETRQGEYADVAGWDDTMPRSGDARVLALRVEFPLGDSGDDAPLAFGEADSAEAMQSAIGPHADGTGTPALGETPYDSLSAYYLRSSYGRLRISGDVYSYEARLPRSAYGHDLMLLFSEALDALGPEVDYGDYDGDGDGIIDCTCMWFAGPDAGWGSDWWSHTSWATTMSDPQVMPAPYGGLSLGSLVVLHRPPSDPGCVCTLIHEVGHALGLPDYYAKGDGGDGAPLGGCGGIGTEDMMNADSGDHNAFSKWMLGWLGDDDVARITCGADGQASAALGTRVVPAGEDGHVHIRVQPASGCSDTPMATAVAVYPKGDDDAMGPLSDLYLVQYDTPEGNQKSLATQGDEGQVRVFRVQGTLSDEPHALEHDDAHDAMGDQLIEAVRFGNDDGPLAKAAPIGPHEDGDGRQDAEAGPVDWNGPRLAALLGGKSFLREGDESSLDGLVDGAPAESLAARRTGIHVRVASATPDMAEIEVWYD